MSHGRTRDQMHLSNQRLQRDFEESQRENKRLREAVAEYRATIEQNERTIARLDEALEKALLGKVRVQRGWDNNGRKIYWARSVDESDDFYELAPALAWARKQVMGDE